MPAPTPLVRPHVLADVSETPTGAGRSRFAKQTAHRGTGHRDVKLVEDHSDGVALADGAALSRVETPCRVPGPAPEVLSVILSAAAGRLQDDG